MGSRDSGNYKEGIEGSNGAKTEDSLDNSTSRRILLRDGNPQRKLGDASPALPFGSRLKFLKFGSASAKFKRIAEQRDEMSQLVVASTSGHHFRERFSGIFGGKIDRESLMKMCKEWFRNPMNLALFVWILCVAISGAILFLVMTGMLNSAIPRKSERNVWFEVNNQILNALFTLMCLYQHPKRFYHLVLLCRWKPNDISRLRKIYCKDGTYKPHEWAHMMVVVILLHVNCFAQYALCGLNLGYKRSERPAIGVGICISIAIGAPAIAGVYTIVSPLGRDYDLKMDEEAQVQTTGESLRPDRLRLKSLEKKYSFASGDEQRVAETRPLWSGGIFDFWDDISIAYLSLFCSFCVFGWNMERFGFGNMYVHIVTFILFCMAPFWIFNLAAVNIDNEAVRQGMVATGLVLCLFGLLYGGFWRIQMRKRFNLPTYNFCFGEPSASDCALWLCCCWCTLAQEVRTGNSYVIIEDKFYRKETDGDDQLPISPLPREDGVQLSPSKSLLLERNSASATPNRQLPTVNEETVPQQGDDEKMIPPAPLVIQREIT
ncbi:PLAC8 family protein [Tripterygium wilfordii]|uniref:PLAC8 family protein n=1 Tax=Tripterygium wilfordii TaxID=458696 RepID=A0A7J7CX09_TRIWF|nr:uncharacterized protein LOC120013107 [Tripterygium wilfordii]KAF5738426.1 PLAC8 family protein [Tripterygium wilfordii]